MKILLITHNRVVKEFIELATDKINASLTVTEDIASVEDSSFDFVFVDDRIGSKESLGTIIKIFEKSVSVILFSQAKELHDEFDIKIKKPFLPSDIQNILEQQSDDKSYSPAEQILNLEDIQEIKNLLDSESEHEMLEEEEILSDTPELDIAKLSQDKILELLLSMEPKKIRKLLKGAELNIQIKFPKENQ